MKIVLDSSVLVSFLNKDDIFYVDTSKFIKQLLRNKEIIIIMPIIIFLEVANVLGRKKRDFKEDYIFSIFQRYEILDINLNFARNLLPLFRQIYLKTSDAIILGTAIMNKATLVTWDERFRKEAKKFADVQTPTTLLSKISS